MMMIKIDIPGYGLAHLEHLVLDFNGTISADGKILPGVKDQLIELAELLELHVLTADTHVLGGDLLPSVRQIEQCHDMIPRQKNFIEQFLRPFFKELIETTTVRQISRPRKLGFGIGSRSIRVFIETCQPLLTLHGHIHESPEISGHYFDRIGNTLSVNPGQFPCGSKLHAVTFEMETPGKTLHPTCFPDTG
jgi:hypothetical protein